MAEKNQRLFQAQLFTDYLKGKLVALLDSVPGKKVLLLQEATASLIEVVLSANMNLLYQHGIIQTTGGLNFVTKMEPLDKSFVNVLVLITPTVKSIFRKSADKNIRRNYVMAFWPRRNMLARQEIEKAGLSSQVQIRDFSFDLIPLANDLYSLEMKSFRQIYLEKDYSYFNYIAQSIHRIQSVFGKIRNFYVKGTAAKVVEEVLRLKENEIKIQQQYGDIQSIIILDRSIDLLTPFVKQLCYQGLIDQAFGFSGNVVKVPNKFIDQKETDQTKMKPQLLQGQKDNIFSMLRNTNIQACKKLLLNKISQIKGLQQDFKSKSTSGGNLKLQMENLKKIQTDKALVSRHLKIVDAAFSYLKEIDYQKELIMEQRAIDGAKEKDIIQYIQCLPTFTPPLYKLLRISAFASLVEKGIHSKTLRTLSTQLVQCYGLTAMMSLFNMSKVGLICQKQATNYSFDDIRKQFKLISNQPIDHQNPNNISFAYGGYIPLTVKLVHEAVRHNWKSLVKAFKYIPGETLYPQMPTVPNCNRPAILVFMVGGVTYSEVSALRLIGKLENKEIVVATTQMITGERIVKSLI